MSKIIEYNFQWDPSKARLNDKKHGVAFERATTVFYDSNALSIFDEWHSSKEERWITLGFDNTATLIVVSHTYQEESEYVVHIRLISARKATKLEIKQYRGD